MSMEMQIFYYIINNAVAILYYLCQLILLSNIVDHKKHIARTIFIYSSVYLIESIITETPTPILIKTTVEMFCFIVLYRLLLSEKTAAVALHIIYYWFICVMLQEVTIVFICKINHINPWVDVGHGVQLGKAWVILISVLFMIILTLASKQILKPFSEMLSGKNTWYLVSAGYILYCIDDMLRALFFQYIESVYLYLGLILIVGIAVVGIVLHIFFFRSICLEQKQREERFKVEALEKQFVHYQDKQKEEERVRSIYHDMKNHLLVLEHRIHAPETAEMVEKLQQEMESYADYVHTGNDFLDVIIKEKAGIAREKQIDFSAAIDLQGLDFIQPLDISTIFGNGLDNAIEASEKLPEGQRVILVKAGRVQNFLSIVMENNCREESISRGKEAGREESLSEEKAAGRKKGISGGKEAGREESLSEEKVAGREKSVSRGKEAGREESLSEEKAAGREKGISRGKGAGRKENTLGRKHTSKKDTRYHGFGISNMKNAAEKYGGQLTAKCGDGKFTLQILIPIP